MCEIRRRQSIRGASALEGDQETDENPPRDDVRGLHSPAAETASSGGASRPAENGSSNAAKIGSATKTRRSQNRLDPTTRAGRNARKSHAGSTTKASARSPAPNGTKGSAISATNAANLATAQTFARRMGSTGLHLRVWHPARPIGPQLSLETTDPRAREVKRRCPRMLSRP